MRADVSALRTDTILSASRLALGVYGLELTYRTGQIPLLFAFGVPQGPPLGFAGLILGAAINANRNSQFEKR